MAETDSRLAALERRWLEEPSPAASMPLAEEFRRLGRHREAVAVLESALRAQPSHTAAQVALGRCLLECERAEQAVTVLQDVLRRDPEQLVANRLLIDALIQRRDAAGSRRQLSIYENLNRRDPAIADLRAKIDGLGSAAAADSLFALETEEPSTLELTELLPGASVSQGTPDPAAMTAKAAPAVPPDAASGDPFPWLSGANDRLTFLRSLSDGWRRLWGEPAVVVEKAPDEERAAPPAPAAVATLAAAASGRDEPSGALFAGLDEQPPAPSLAALFEASAPSATMASEAPPPVVAPPPQEVSATLGDLYLQQGHADEAAKIFQQVLERSPQDEAAADGLRTALHSAASRAVEVPGPSRARRIERLSGYLERIRRGRVRVVR